MFLHEGYTGREEWVRVKTMMNLELRNKRSMWSGRKAHCNFPGMFSQAWPLGFFFHRSTLCPFHSECNILIRRWACALEWNGKKKEFLTSSHSHSGAILFPLTDLLAWRLWWWISQCCAKRLANQNPVSSISSMMSNVRCVRIYQKTIFHWP